MTPTPEALPPLPPCPMCGGAKGYTLSEGSTYRWWDVSCAACGREIGECASDRRTHLGGILPDRWEAADEAWNDAAAHAESLRAALAQRQQVPAITDAMVDAYLQANDAYWREVDALATDLTKPWRQGTPKEATRVSLVAALTAAPSAQAEIPDLRCAKWLDPECADAGACQSLKFKAAPSAQAEPTVPVPTVVAWAGGAVPYRFVRLRLDDTPTEYEYVPAAQAEPQEPLEFNAAQRRRLWDNSPEIHDDAKSYAAFERIVQLVEAAHGIGKQEGKL